MDFLELAFRMHYNFAVLPEVKSQDALLQLKEDKTDIHPESKFKKIHMPHNSGRPLIMSVAFGIAGFVFFQLQ